VTLPFSHDAFLDVFAIYNRAWWPVAVILWLVTVAAVIQLTRGQARGAGLAAILAVHWAWAGVAYHWLAFTTINPAAPVFAGAFLLQALAFVWTGVVGHRLAFAWGRAPRHWVAAGLLLMALAYPVLAQLTVGVGPRAPTFGVPCPTALFTAGCLLAAVPPVPRGLLVIPVLWSLIGGSAALLLGIRIDLALFVAAAASCSSLAPGILERPEPT
jgi:hypothetical protein